MNLLQRLLPQSFSPAHLSLFFTGLLWVLPFLYWAHTSPIPTFYSEWGAAVLGLCAAFWLVMRRLRESLEIPYITLLPLGMLFLIWLQYAVGKDLDFSQLLLFTLYLLWIALLVMLGQQLREKFGLPTVSLVLALFLLLGSEVGALFGLAQHYGWRGIGDIYIHIVTVKVSAAVYGNMAQPNHFANYTAMGLMSLGLLYSRQLMRWWLSALLAAPLLFVMVLSGSRSSWLYLIGATLMAYFWQRRNQAHRALLHYCAALLLGFGLMHFVVQIPGLEGTTTGSVNTMQRLMGDASGSATAPQGILGSAQAIAHNMFSEGSSGRVRLRLWYESWLLFTQFPILGTGIGQYPWQHLQMLPGLHDTNVTGLNIYAHNIVLQVAAELGLLGLIVFFGTLGLWLRQACRTEHTPEHWWGYGLLLTQLIHSLLEYPLWYGYFWGIAGIALGLFDAQSFRIKQGLIGRATIAVVLLTGVSALVQMWTIYPKLEMLNSSIPPESMRNGSYEQRVQMQQVSNRLQALRQQSYLFRNYTEMVLAEAGWDHLADNGALNERIMRFAPTPQIVYREAIILARLGKQQEAQTIIEQAIWSYPVEFTGYLPKFQALAQSDPDQTRFPALLKFAVEKFEERQRAVVHTN